VQVLVQAHPSDYLSRILVLAAQVTFEPGLAYTLCIWGRSPQGATQNLDMIAAEVTTYAQLGLKTVTLTGAYLLLTFV
jgi:hypothetical protein